MTDESIKAALENLANSVNQHKVEITKSVAKVETKVELLQKSQDKLDTTVDQIALAQASCPARTGLDGQNARIKRLEKKSSDDKIDVRAELSSMREDQTGSIEEAALIAAKAVATPKNSGILGTFGWRGLFQVLFYLLAAAFIAGMYVNGADTEQVEQVIQNVREINRTVEKVKQEVNEPIAVPLPVTPAECVSEEVAP